MKKILLILVASLTLVGCTGKGDDNAHTTVQVKNPIELTTTTPNMSEYTYLEDSSPAFEEITFQESLRMWEENGTGIVFYGMPSCYWCQRAVPSINAAAKDVETTVYYVNLGAGVDEETFDKFLEYADSILGTDANGEKVFSYPEVIAIKDGKIVGNHLSVVESYDPGTQDYLTDEQAEELVGIYKDLFLSINN